MVHGQAEYGKLQRHNLLDSEKDITTQTNCYVIELCTHDTHDKRSKFNNVQELESIIRK